MSRPFKFSNETREKAEGLLLSGVSYRQVGVLCGLSLSQVQRVARDMVAVAEEVRDVDGV